MNYSEYDVLFVLDKFIDLALVLSTVSLVVIRVLPGLQSFFKYGKTSLNDHEIENDKFAMLLKLRVPKKWFYQFYVASFLEAALCLYSIGLNYKESKYGLVLVLALLQSLRRWYECLFVNIPSKSKIHLSHYLVGFYFYFCVNVNNWLKFNLHHEGSQFSHITTGTALLIFVLASVDQYRNHRHLASLVKYNQPSKGMFQLSASAHYLDEIAIYFAHFIILQNFTSFMIFLHVALSLSMSATESYKFYKKQSDGRVVSKYKIIPFVY